ncbi:tripeptidyl-peptidase 1-like [Sycon ciliatum]|uniref:tripeptidyl-peptidase 1-like n=1 Tax=Sycon ciliatum TaxID=27933 RepID=UPI0031F706EA
MATYRLLLAVFVALVCCDHSVLGARVRLEADQLLAKHHPDWRELGLAKPDDDHKLVFALRQSNLIELEEKLLAVSTPGSPQYGQFLSADQVDALVRPSRKSLHAVEGWLTRTDVSVSQSCKYTKAREFLECDVTVSQASQLLQVSFYQYEMDGAIALRANNHYTVPAEVADHLDFVGGVHRLPHRQQRLANSTQYAIAKAHGVNLQAEPSSLRELYKVGSSVGAGEENKNIQCVAQFLDQHYHATDLAKFMEKFGTGFTHMSKVAKEIGPNTGHAGVEASLDIEYIMALGANIPTYFWSTGGKHEGQEPFLVWIEAVANSSTIPNVISVSYGDDEDTLSVPYMQRINVEFQKLGVRGTSILFASGDDGAGCHKQVFRPNFPATSPYVTSVGGTQLSGEAEMGVSFSSGGFSNVFQQVSYQAADIKEFFSISTHIPSERFFNKTGRGYPDVSALAVNFEVIMDLFPVPASGTSCAAPTFSGIISLVNDKLINGHSKTALGFLNPFLYAHGFAGLTDIEHGCNEGCSGDGFCSVKGWDPVTGLGTPLYPSLLEEALKAKNVH